MTPVAFSGCFGWLHEPPDGTGCDVAVVICTAFSTDAAIGHCSLTLLADQLAAAGYPALRFDYPGTGDSLDSGLERGDGHWSAWKKSVHAAADWLRAATGARRVVLCGLRIGATLATLAGAERDDVAGLLLFEPVVVGKSFVRQLRLEAELLTGRRPDKGDSFEHHGLRFCVGALDQMAAADLRHVAIPAGTAVGLFARQPARQVSECATAWSLAGASVACPDWSGLDPLVRDNPIAETRLADFEGVFVWLRQAIVAESGRSIEPVQRLAALQVPGCIEAPISFGTDRRLFGVLCQPENGAAREVVLIPNTGRDPHHGPARQAVTFARRLAAEGVASLRFDFAGLGDSAAPPGKEGVRSHVFQVERAGDIRAAIDRLQGLGFERFAVQGLCSGAYHAFHAALADERISTLMLVNIPLFRLPGRDVQGYLDQRWLPRLHYVRQLVSADRWRAVLQGEVDLMRAARAQFVHVPAHAIGRATSAVRRLGVAREQSFARRSMATLSRRGVRTLFMFSPGAGESEIFAREFGQDGEGLEAFPGTALEVVPGLDHGMMKAVQRQQAETSMIRFLGAARR
jgi:pimeloyl-ACP methyl ester carboxylesterase